jgi:hypothetical protein
MAALTSAGPWPVADADYVDFAALPIVYGRVTPRLALTIGTAVTAATGVGGPAAMTTFPTPPSFTRFPVTP